MGAERVGHEMWSEVEPIGFAERLDVGVKGEESRTREMQITEGLIKRFTLCLSR